MIIAARFFSLYCLRRYHVSVMPPTSLAAAFLRLDAAIFSVSSGTTVAGSIAARSSRKVPQPALRKSFERPRA